MPKATTAVGDGANLNMAVETCASECCVSKTPVIPGSMCTEALAPDATMCCPIIAYFLAGDDANLNMAVETCASDCCVSKTPVIPGSICTEALAPDATMCCPIIAYFFFACHYLFCLYVLVPVHRYTTVVALCVCLSWELNDSYCLASQFEEKYMGMTFVFTKKAHRIKPREKCAVYVIHIVSLCANLSYYQ